MVTLSVRLKLVCLGLFLALPGIWCDGHGNANICDMTATTCEFYLEASHWLPMRRGFFQKVYVNESNGKLYTFGDEKHTPVDPNEVVLADGSTHDKPLTLFNKTMPGPTLTVYVYQEVVVHVTNRLLSDGITVHFHGIEMRGTPWMDGAAFITQCPILPGQTFTYRFRPNRSGTYFYHSHTGAQVNMGLVGAFIVKEKEPEKMEELVLVLQDYNNRASNDELYTTVILEPYTPEGNFIPPRRRQDGSFSPLIQITSTLINGRGRFSDKVGNHLTKSPLSVFRVSEGTSYRFRAIGGGYAYQHILSVDNHKLKVVATDGNEIEPIIVDLIVIHTGERFDFVLEAKKNIGNYWIRAETFHDTKELTANAVLRYDGAEDNDPTSSKRECTKDDPCSAVNCPFETFPNWSCIPTDKMRAADASDPAPASNSGNFKEFFISTGFAMQEGPEPGVYGHMNGVRLKLPPVSALTQPREVTGICDEGHHCLPDKACHCNRPLTVNSGDVVQITFVNPGFFTVSHHPIHVHGYSFHVLKVGYHPENLTFTSDIKCTSENCFYNTTWSDQTWKNGNIPNIDLTRAPRKDTVVLPGGGYVVIRFVADNPGLWYIHCHQEMHNQIGIGILLNDSFLQIPAPPVGFPECRNYPAPEWVAALPYEETSTQTTETECTGKQLYCRDRLTCATYCDGQMECDGQEDETNCPATEADERTFTQEEFWGMFGAMMFVVLVQFILALTCTKRNNKSFDF